MSVLKRKGIIFDFDGVILDSVSIKGEMFGALFTSFGQEVVDQIIAYHHANGGLPRYEKFEFIHRHILNIGYTEADSRRLACEFEALVLDRLIQANPIVGAVEFLEFCKTNDIRASINTAAPEFEVNCILEAKGWDHYFSFVCGNTKTKSENIRQTLDFWRFDESAILFFGDTSNDLKAAAEAKVEFVGIGKRENFEENSPKDFQVFHDFQEVLKSVYS
ncbi:MAG: HAD family hydrolase [Candidatus Puniceispirillaceae bacterium]